jgi:hypothetical protein
MVSDRHGAFQGTTAEPSVVQFQDGSSPVAHSETEKYKIVNILSLTIRIKYKKPWKKHVIEKRLVFHFHVLFKISQILFSKEDLKEKFSESFDQNKFVLIFPKYSK